MTKNAGMETASLAKVNGKPMYEISKMCRLLFLSLKKDKITARAVIIQSTYDIV
jgi:hypothetical protein